MDLDWVCACSRRRRLPGRGRHVHGALEPLLVSWPQCAGSRTTVIESKVPCYFVSISGKASFVLSYVSQVLIGNLSIIFLF